MLGNKIADALAASLIEEDVRRNGAVAFAERPDEVTIEETNKGSEHLWDGAESDGRIGTQQVGSVSEEVDRVIGSVGTPTAHKTIFGYRRHRRRLPSQTVCTHV